VFLAGENVARNADFARSLRRHRVAVDGARHLFSASLDGLQARDFREHFFGRHAAVVCSSPMSLPKPGTTSISLIKWLPRGRLRALRQCPTVAADTPTAAPICVSVMPEAEADRERASAILIAYNSTIVRPWCLPPQGKDLCPIVRLWGKT